MDPNSPHDGRSLLERAFEYALWSSRLIVLVPVVVSIALSFAAVYLATVEAISVLTHLSTVVELGIQTTGGIEAANNLLATIIKATDIYLLAAILLIFGLGLYELFVGSIEPAERATNAPKLLLIRNLDDLKGRLARVVLLVLVIEFLQYALRISFQTALDLLYLAVGILLIGAAVFLSTLRTVESPKSEGDPPSGDGG